MKKLSLSCGAALLVLVLLFSGCASRPTVSADNFTAACEAAGLEVTDSIAQFDPAMTLVALTAATDEFSAGYFVFASGTTARANYAQMLSSVQTGASGEKTIDSSEYNRFSGVSGDTKALLYRNGATLIFITGAGDDYDAVVEALGL